MKERLKKLRKALNLTQQEFADRIGISRGNIATYETRDGSPGSSVITLICREFNVSEEWLRTGVGEMFMPREEDALAELAKQRGLTFSDRVLVEKFLELKPESRQAVIEYMEKVVAALSQDQPAAAVQAWTPADAGGQERTEVDTGGGTRPRYHVPTDEDIEREVEDFRRRLLLEKKQADRPSPSNEGGETA